MGDLYKANNTYFSKLCLYLDVKSKHGMGIIGFPGLTCKIKRQQAINNASWEQRISLLQISIYDVWKCLNPGQLDPTGAFADDAIWRLSGETLLQLAQHISLLTSDFIRWLLQTSAAEEPPHPHGNLNRFLCFSLLGSGGCRHLTKGP